MKRLFIAEKKEVANALAEAFGYTGKPSNHLYQTNQGNITWLSGHLLELTEPQDHDDQYQQWSLDHLPMSWAIRHKPISNKGAHLNAVIDHIRSASELINAGDPDAEGQLLVDEVIEYAGVDTPVKRILINDNNAPAILKAVDAMQDNRAFAGLSKAALARSVCDMRYGLNLTRLYTKMAEKIGYDDVLSVGRVQTPILGLVVNRDHAHESHQEAPYYTVKAKLKTANCDSIAVTYQPSKSDTTDEQSRLTQEDQAESIMQACKNQPAKLTSLKTEEKRKAPPLPYNLLQLQSDAAKQFGYKPKEVLAYTQELRDKHKAITYNRSDCQYLNEERHSEAPALLAALTPHFHQAENADQSLKSKAFNSGKVTAHHAIIPTENVPDVSTLSEPHRNIYQLIATRYIAQFYPDEQWQSTTAIFDIERSDQGTATFKTTSRTDGNPGWTTLYPRAESQQADTLSSLTQGEAAQVKSTEVKQDFTQPKPYYTMAALLKDLANTAKYVTDSEIKKLLLEKDADKAGESGGIGTPATRDTMIDTLFRRRWIQEKGKNIVSTKLGRKFIAALPPEASRVDLTALWHEKQKEIEAGNLDYKVLIDEVDQYVADECERVKRDGIPLKLDIKVHDCPTCGNPLKKRRGKKGDFWGCSNYPNCTTTLPDKNGKPDTTPKEQPDVTEHTCPSCKQGQLVRKPAKKKKGKPQTYWYGCNQYPVCTYTTFEKNGKPVIT